MDFNLFPNYNNHITEAEINIYNYSCTINRPSYLYKPKLFIDGDKWCALYGENLQDGIAGFGGSPELAYQDFDIQWHKML